MDQINKLINFFVHELFVRFQNETFKLLKNASKTYKKIKKNPRELKRE